MGTFDERSTRVYKQKQMFSKAELGAREKRCVHEQPPFCAAACPLKLDARAFVQTAAKGDFTAARAMLEKIAPFPHILAEGCTAPCAAACRLGEKGEGVHIGGLERAALAHGAPRRARGSMFKIKKKKTAAVFGAELFTLALVGELAEKSYPLHFFVEEADAAALLSRCAPFLSAAGRAAETERLAKLDAHIHYQSPLDAAFFEAHKADFDLLGVSAAMRDALGLGEIDAQCLTTKADILAPTAAEEKDVLGALYGAKRAALSADRLAQGLRPDNMRGEEGTVESRLYTDMRAVEASRRVEEGAAGYGAEEARAEAARCIDCRCEACIQGCAYLRHYKTFPRLLTREIYNNVSIIMGDHMMNKPINSCALCGQCAALCPNGYDMGEICRAARANMVQTEKMPLAAHEFALYDMLFSNNEAFLARKQPGHADCKYLFFPGCQAGAIAPDTVRAAYLDLCERLEGGVGLLLGCCGAIADWAGRDGLFEETAEKLRGAWEEMGRPIVIALCPSCRRTLEKILDGEILSLWTLLVKIGLPEGHAQKAMRAAVHDACGARGDGETQAAVRTLAARMGLELIELPYSGDETPCCGYGGLVGYANPPVAAQMAKARTEMTDAPLLSYCMACRDRFARQGHTGMHILELVYGKAASACPDLSEKRKNRLALQNGLRRELWQEEIMEEKTPFPLVITEAARRAMDERMILESDMAAVLMAYRESGEAVFDEEAGLLVARKRIGNVTFWARFVETAEGGYELRGAYSHRMRVD